jgi:hypothetical protein
MMLLYTLKHNGCLTPKCFTGYLSFLSDSHNSDNANLDYNKDFTQKLVDIFETIFTLNESKLIL